MQGSASNLGKVFERKPETRDQIGAEFSPRPLLSLLIATSNIILYFPYVFNHTAKWFYQFKKYFATKNILQQTFDLVLISHYFGLTALACVSSWPSFARPLISAGAWEFP